MKVLDKGLHWVWWLIHLHAMKQETMAINQDWVYNQAKCSCRKQNKQHLICLLVQNWASFSENLFQGFRLKVWLKGPLTLWKGICLFFRCFPMHKISLVSFWIGRLMYEERIKVIIRQADPYDKKGDSTKGDRGCKIWLHQIHLEINCFHV